MKNPYKILIVLLLVTFLSAQTFDDYFRLAVERDPGLQAKYKTVEIALQKAAQVSALPDPAISFAYFVSPVETRLGPQQYKLSLTQMFPWFGTLKAQKQAAALQAEAAYQTFLNERNALYADVAAAYYPLIERRYWIKAEEENIGNLLQLKELTENKVANGRGSLINVLRIDRMLEESRTILSILQREALPLKAGFNALLDRDPGTEVIASDDIFASFNMDISSLDTSFKRHPALEALDLKIRSKNYDEKAAIKKGLPNFGIGLDYVAVGDRTDMVVAESGRDVLMPMISISIPLARGKYKAAVRQVRLEKERLSLEKKALSYDLLSRYEQIRYNLQTQIERSRLYHNQIKTTQSMLNLLLERYAKDGSDLEELLRVQRELLQYEKMEASALSMTHINYAKLLYISARVDN